MVEWKTIGDISTNVFAGGTPSTKQEMIKNGRKRKESNRREY